MSNAPTPFLMRPTVLEYRVTGSLDGTTLAPLVELPPAQGSPLDSENFVTQTVQNLGLINLARAGGPAGQYAGRFIKWIKIVGPAGPVASPNVGIAFNEQLTRSELVIPAGSQGIYSRNCIFVPQTAQLYLNGMVASGLPVVVQIALWQPRSLEELTAIIEACCCKGGCVNDLDAPCFAQGLYANTEQVTVTDVDPTVAFRGVQESFTVTGTGFDDGVSVIVRRITPIVGAPPRESEFHIDDITVNSPTELVVTATPGSDLELGLYDLIVSPALGSSAFAYGLADAINLSSL